MKQATEVVAHAIRNWKNFARKAAVSVGSDVFPEKPCVGWLFKYHASTVMMLHEELQSIAKKQAEEEQAKKEALASETAKAVQKLKSIKPSVTLLQLSPEQLSAYFDMLEDPTNEDWFNRVSEKYGEWRPAKPDEKGIPCRLRGK